MRSYMILQLAPGDEVHVRHDGTLWHLDHRTADGLLASRDKVTHLFVVPRSIDVDEAWAKRPTGTRFVGGSAHVVGTPEGLKLRAVTDGELPGWLPVVGELEFSR